jgi:A/G-specific adenine glycosylase
VTARSRPRDPLARWYAAHGRHDLAWRATRDRWHVLVSEVMLQQTQVARVAAAWDGFIGRFPDPATTARAGPAAVVQAWGRLGYPRRARRLWEAACSITARGWPTDLATLPGVGRYTAAAVEAQVDDADVIGVEANIRRVCQRVAGSLLGERAAERVALDVGGPLSGRDRLLALMDLGALVCTAREPRCVECPLHDRCATRGPLDGERRVPQTRFDGSFRQRRGRVLARLREGPAPVAELDDDALAALVDDRLAEIRRGRARLARR